MTNTAAITPIKRDRIINTIADQIKVLKDKRYINRTTKYIIVK